MTIPDSSSIERYTLRGPFSAISAPNGLLTPDSSTTGEDENAQQGDEGSGDMYGGHDEREE
jgi:hypothetical protein